MKNANVRVLVIVFALVVLVAAAGAVIGLMGPGDAEPETSGRVTMTPAAPERTADTKAYLRIQVGSEIWPLIPLTDGGEYTVTQPTGETNIIHTTAQGAVMHFSTCDNQNCVDQGAVTLDNREEGILGNMIICLPNEVVLELHTPETLEGVLGLAQ